MTNINTGLTTFAAARDNVGSSYPVGVLDIGSNSIRLVVYERHARWLTPIHNEKASAALGRGVAQFGRIADEGIDVALRAIKRFALISKLMNVSTVHILATSAVREAENGAAFSDAVREIMDAPVRVLSGSEEAHFASLGVVAGIPEFKGVVGDLGGGSLEFSRINGGLDTEGETHALGAIRMQDDSGESPDVAVEIARERIAGSKVITQSDGGVFCAIGGTWRSIAKLHQERSNYPLHMVQDYTITGDEVIELCERIVRASMNKKALTGMKVVSSSRRDLLPYGAAVLSETVKAGGFSQVVFSALGVREGFLFGLLTPEEQAADPLLQAANEISQLGARSSFHASELIDLADKTWTALFGEQALVSQRLRQAACLLSDIGWRGHPDYRGEQSVDLVAYSAMTGIDHPGRAFLAESLAVRYMGLKHKSISSSILELAGEDEHINARRFGAFLRVAYTLSAGMPGVLPHLDVLVDGEELVLQVPQDMAFLVGDRVKSRLAHFANTLESKTSAVRVV